MATMVAGGPDRDSLHSGKWEEKAVNIISALNTEFVFI